MELDAMEVVNALRKELEQKTYENILLKLKLESISKVEEVE